MDHAMKDNTTHKSEFLESGGADDALRLTELGIVVIDINGTIVGANSAARVMLNLPQAACGGDFQELVPAMRALFDGRMEHDGGQFTLARAAAGQGDIDAIAARPDERGFRVIVCREVLSSTACPHKETGPDLLMRLDSLMARHSHDMRNPLASILAGLQALERSSSLSSDDAFILKLLIGEARTAIGIVERFTNALRTGANAISRIPVDRLVQNSVADFNENARKQQISLGLIPGPPDAWIIGDEQVLNRALGNLIQNALDASDQGGRIDVGWRVLTDEQKREIFPQFMGAVVLIFGRDRGSGLPPHIPEQVLFEPFVTTKRSAAGLGLSVAQRIIETHGGMLSLHSLESGGTEFKVFLPLGERADCWEVMHRQRTDNDCADSCEACEVKRGRARQFCWMAKTRSADSAQVFPPHACARCAFFGSFNLVSASKASTRS